MSRATALVQEMDYWLEQNDDVRVRLATEQLLMAAVGHRGPVGPGHVGCPLCKAVDRLEDALGISETETEQDGG